MGPIYRYRVRMIDFSKIRSEDYYEYEVTIRITSCYLI